MKDNRYQIWRTILVLHMKSIANIELLITPIEESRTRNLISSQSKPRIPRYLNIMDFEQHCRHLYLDCIPYIWDGIMGLCEMRRHSITELHVDSMCHCGEVCGSPSVRNLSVTSFVFIIASFFNIPVGHPRMTTPITQVRKERKHRNRPFELCNQISYL